MRKLLSYFILLLAALSCEKQQGEGFYVDRFVNDTCDTVTFVIDQAMTKAYTGTDMTEISIEQVVYLAFNSKGYLLNKGNSNQSAGLCSLVLPYGEVTVHAYVNVTPDLFDHVTHISQLDYLEYSYYDSRYYVLDCFPMSGKCEFTMDGTVSEVKQITVERYHSRLCVTSIANRLDLSDSGTGNGLIVLGTPMYLKGVFLTNLQGSVYLENESNTGLWYSKFGRPDRNPTNESRITDAQDLNTGKHSYEGFDGILANNNSLNLSSNPIKLYAFPNHTEYDDFGWSEVFTERQTRIVLAAEIKGVVYYYPVNLVNMQRNTTYDVNFVITRLGSLDPDTFIFVDEGDLDNDHDVTIDFGGFDDGGDITITF